MEYRRLGNTGVKVSAIGLGANQFGSASVPDGKVKYLIDLALDHGVNFIDTADIYENGRSEITIGNALKGRWNHIVLASKFYLPMGNKVNDQGASRYHLMNAINASLSRLQSDHIDLYYVHRWDTDTPIEETLRALDDLIRMGKIRYIAASRYAACQLAHANLLAVMRGWTPFSVLQAEYHLFARGVETEVLAYCQAHQVGFVPYFPLAGGFLTGKYRRDQAIPKDSRGEHSAFVQKFMIPVYYDKISVLENWAREREHTMTELAQAWLLACPAVCSVISGVTKPEQLMANIKAAEWRLSPAERDQVSAL